MLPCRLRYVAVSWLCSVPLCTCRSWIPWHMVAQLYDLALACPTLCRSQLYDMLLRRHMGAQHMFWSTSLYILLPSRWTSFIMLWYTMWHLLLHDIDYLSGGYMWYIMDILYLVYMLRFNYLCTFHHHYLLQSMTFSSMNIVTIWTWVYWHTCSPRLFHVPLRLCMLVMLLVSTVYDLVTLQYYQMELLLSLCCSFYRATRHPLALWTSRFRWSQLRWLCAS